MDRDAPFALAQAPNPAAYLATTSGFSAPPTRPLMPETLTISPSAMRTSLLGKSKTTSYRLKQPRQIRCRMDRLGKGEREHHVGCAHAKPTLVLSAYISTASAHECNTPGRNRCLHETTS